MKTFIFYAVSFTSMVQAKEKLCIKNSRDNFYIIVKDKDR